MEILIPMIVGAIISTIFYKLAQRKNRRGWVWGTVTGFCLVVFIFSIIAIPSCFSKTDRTGAAIASIVGVVIPIGIFVISAIILAFLPPICLKCNKKLTRKQWKNKECPQCGIL